MNQNTTYNKPKHTAYFSSALLFTGVQHWHIAFQATKETLSLRTLRPIYVANWLIQIFYPTFLYWQTVTEGFKLFTLQTILPKRPIKKTNLKCYQSLISGLFAVQYLINIEPNH